jgi:hypothetical protein
VTGSRGEHEGGGAHQAVRRVHHARLLRVLQQQLQGHLVTLPDRTAGLRIRIRIQSGQWIRIRIRNPDPDPGGQK